MSKLNKIARKSTWVDMTAFVDVSFLILTFFTSAGLFVLLGAEFLAMP